MTGRALAVVETEEIPPVTRRDPVGSMLSVPEWLHILLIAVSVNEHGMPVWSRTPMIDAKLMPTPAQRQAIEHRCSQIERMLVPGPEIDIAATVTEILLFYANGQTTPEHTRVKVKTYCEALEGLPAWAVEEGRRRWFRGECGDHNSGFAPSPDTIRKAAEAAVKTPKGTLIILRRILNAKPANAPMPEERRREMAAKMHELINGLAQA